MTKAKVGILEPDRGTIAWFKHRKRILLRDISAFDDFNAAHSAIERILEAADDWASTDPTDQLKGALFMIAVVTYARQFVESSTTGGKKETFGIRRLKSGANFDRELHKQLIELRHRLIAHDDREALPPALYMYGAEIVIDGGSVERKPIAATLASYSFNSVATQLFLRKMQKHLLICIESLNGEIRKGLLEYLSEASISNEYSKVSDKAPRQFKDAAINFGPNQTGKLGDVEQFKARMIRVPSGGIHKLEYSYRVTTYSSALPHIEFGSGDKTVLIHVGELNAKNDDSPSSKRLGIVRARIGNFIGWWRQPF